MKFLKIPNYSKGTKDLKVNHHSLILMTTINPNITLDTIDKRIRERETIANPSDDAILTAKLYIRQQHNMGLELENSCPYIRTKSEIETCNPFPLSNCIEKEIYRKCPNYALRLDSEEIEIFQ